MRSNNISSGSSTRTDDLTTEQRAVVQHNHGPAVVLAVPGAGKTTVLIHRIRHLVADRGVPPERILACSFNRDSVEDLTVALHTLGIEGVDVRTLHSLGCTLLQHAGVQSPTSSEGPRRTAQILARQSLRSFAEQQNQTRADLDISASDLVNQIAAWKQQLAYPDLDAADLPAEARPAAQQADHENEEYLALYRDFERRRRENGGLTYPDMLRDGWELLMRDDALRRAAQSAYDYVLVDEFQDVSRAQFQILDVLTASHRNYMVVGDDDQCIYSWRGASPSHLRNFAGRYDAATYEMRTSFRLPAAPLVLANGLLQHDESSSTKQIQLVRGFGGDAGIFDADTPKAEASRLVETIERQREAGYSLDDMAILVRTYGQTPPFEEVLVSRELPYILHGHPPFYRRRPVQVLLRYLYWAVLERRRRTTGWFHSPEQAEQYVKRFRQIVNSPNRYVAHGRLDYITKTALNRQTSVLDVMDHQVRQMADRTAARVESFLQVADVLVSRLSQPAHSTLKWLVESIGYESALREQSASPSREETRIQTMHSLLRYATNYNSASALLAGIQSLDANRRTLNDGEGAAVDIRSIHRAKGLEWPVVFVPGCTEGTLPLQQDGSARSDVSEERRLFYVAITRTQEQLYLSTNGSPSSRFLDEAKAGTRLPVLRSIKTALTDDPNALTDEQMAQLCRGIVEFGLDSYIRQHWSPDVKQARALQTRVEDLQSAIADAESQKMAYQRARAEYEEDVDEARDTAHERVSDLCDTLGAVTLTAEHETPETVYPADAVFRFAWNTDQTVIIVYWHDQQIGQLDPFDAGRLDAQTVLALPWDRIVGRFEGVRESRRQILIRIDWDATKAEWVEAAAETLDPPEPLDDRICLLTRSSVREGCAQLLNYCDTRIA